MTLIFEVISIRVNLPSFLADRIEASRTNRFAGLVIRISLGATIISVAVMIITLALAEGFQQGISEKVFSFWGHIRIQEKQPGKAIIAEEIPIRHNEALLHQLQQQPGVEGVYPFATRYALLKTSENMEGVMLKGLERNEQFLRLAPFLQEGRMPNLPDRIIDLAIHSQAIAISTERQPVDLFYQRGCPSPCAQNVHCGNL
jgi:lipoprotein-releasing system permease protein